MGDSNTVARSPSLTAVWLDRALRERLGTLSRWLAENGDDCQETQAHLNADSVERIFWHYGYLVALRDVLRLLDSKKTH
jgi:hypothetical protein